MRWGIRKDGKPGSSRGPANSEKSSLTDPRTLSDSDLKAAVSRMQLERQFSQLQSERVVSGEHAARDLLKEIGKRQLNRVKDKAIDIAVEQAISAVGKKAGIPGADELAKRLKPKKK